MYLSEIKMKEIQTKEGNNNWIFIYDRSGSMHHVLKRLGEDIIKLSGYLKVGDTLSIGYFSGQKEYRFILKGFLITEGQNTDAIRKIVTQNISSIGLTCFSDVLEESITVIQELKTVYPANSFVLCFLTDGVPYPGGRTEESRIFENLSKLNESIGDSIFVGYGDYYGKDLMVKMAEQIGGSFVHADEIEDFSKNVEIIIKNGTSSNKIEIDISGSEDVVLVFGKSNGQIKIYPHKNGKAFVSNSEKEVYAVTSKMPKKNNESLDNLYAGAYSLALQGKVQEALGWLGQIGDKYLVDKLNNSFTVSEFGEATQAIHEACFDESKRLLDGFRKNYVPKPDAFCILDAIDALVADKNAFFYPTHSKWEYKKKGASPKMKEGFVKFEKDTSCECPFAGLTMNKKRLNLSVRTVLGGTIALDDNHDDFNLPKDFLTYQWKNYSIVTDGILNVKRIPASMSKETFDILKSGGLIKKTEKFVQDEVYVLDLKRIPVMNRTIGNSFTSAKDLAEVSLNEESNKAVIKTLKYLKDKIDTSEYKTTSFTEKYTESQINYLFENGISTDGSYAPSMEPAKTEDFYMARTFEIKVSGFSSIPSIASVLKKKEEKKKLNYVDNIILDTIDQYEKMNLEELKEQIKKVDEKIKACRVILQRAKFAVVLGKSKFNEFDSNEGEVATDSGIKVKFEFGEEKVKF